MEYDATQPLPDSDLVMDEFDVTNSEEATQEEVTAKVTRSRWLHSADFSIATTSDGNDSISFNLTSLPVQSLAYLAYRGFALAVSSNGAAQATFDRLMTGERLGEKGRAGSDKSPKAVDLWRQAIALALVDATKKAPAGQMTLEVATSRAVAMDKEKVKAMKLDPAVLKHFNKLSGGTIGYSVAVALAEEAATA